MHPIALAIAMLLCAATAREAWKAGDKVAAAILVIVALGAPGAFL